MRCSIHLCRINQKWRSKITTEKPLEYQHKMIFRSWQLSKSLLLGYLCVVVNMIPNVILEMKTVKEQLTASKK